MKEEVLYLCVVPFKLKVACIHWYLSQNSTFLDLGSIANIEQHEIISPITYNIVIFAKKYFLKKFGPLPWQPVPQEIVDVFFIKLEPFSFPIMYRYCF